MRRTSPLASALYDTEIDSAAEDALANRQVARRFRRKIYRRRSPAGDQSVLTVDGSLSMAEEDLKAELERLKAENERLKSRSTRGVTLKVSEKGGVSVYGLGRFPVTLYKEQWVRVLDMSDDIRAFIKENDAKLKAKD
jgi:hypothetical protein